MENSHARRVLDVYSPPQARDFPVVFWMHGGGWQAGEKSSVDHKPKWFMEQGFLFVSTNYRLLPEVDMGTLIRDCAKSLAWVQKYIAAHGGNPQRILVGGHSAGAHLAAVLCTDERYLTEAGGDFHGLIGCLPVDGDTYNVPAIFEVAETRNRAHGLPMPNYGHRLKFGDDPATLAETRNRAHGLPMPNYGHRLKFGDDPATHRDFSAVTHVAKGKGIPPFLILHVSGHPDTTAQAVHFGNVLKSADVPTTGFGAKDSNHVKLNDDPGLPADHATATLKTFVQRILKR